MFRLSPDLIPHHYDLTLKVNLKEGSYIGEETINVQVINEINKIVFHSYGLNISSIILNDTPYSPTAIIQDRTNMTITLPTRPLNKGHHDITLSFEGDLNRENGFFVVEEDGELYAATLFESIYARTAFPCFDEPSYRATFDITLITHPQYLSLSNMPVKSIYQKNETKITHFETTPPLSTYLVSFIIGKFNYMETFTLSNIPIRIYLPAHKIQEGSLSLKVARRAVEIYEEFLGVPYSLPKMDLVGIPNVVCPACALEAWGNIVYMDKCLIPTGTTQNYLYVIQTIAHEIAHQWFGNLVSIRWWSDLWLKEAFAQYLSYLIFHELTDLRLAEYFTFEEVFPGIMGKMLSPESSVVREVHNLYEIEELYDTIVYNFGSSIIRMIHNLMGDDSFRRLLSIFLVKFSYHSASTQDFLNLLEEEHPEASTIMRSWLYGKNLPILHNGENTGQWILPSINNDNMMIPILTINQEIKNPIDLYELFLVTYWGKVPFKDYIDALESYPPTNDYLLYFSTLNVLEKLRSIFRQDRNMLSGFKSIERKYLQEIKNLSLPPDDLNTRLLRDLHETDYHPSPPPKLVKTLDLKILYCQRRDLRRYINVKGTRENIDSLRRDLLNDFNQMKYTIERAIRKKKLDLDFKDREEDNVRRYFLKNDERKF